MAMVDPVLIVVIVSAVVLLSLPTMFIFLAYHTHKQRKGWKEEHDRAVRSLDREMRRSRERDQMHALRDKKKGNGNGHGNDRDGQQGGRRARYDDRPAVHQDLPR
ncbi:hypothetical protein VPNG_03754 [Cytospora leucostoma]|uniref:Uncharacterized protein n=1 Tax=Cytospora leucostoma TaxID=1230097 RepID=A0A423XFF7_9PEZI|nr:hypothetical protein VPNG_03754 [Cytospora leucostoma]